MLTGLTLNSCSQTQVGPQCCPAALLPLSSPFSLQDDYFLPSPVSSHLQNFLPHPHSQMSLASDFTEKKQKQSEEHVHIHLPQPSLLPCLHLNPHPLPSFLSINRPSPSQGPFSHLCIILHSLFYSRTSHQ